MTCGLCLHIYNYHNTILIRVMFTFITEEENMRRLQLSVGLLWPSVVGGRVSVQNAATSASLVTDLWACRNTIATGNVWLCQSRNLKAKASTLKTKANAVGLKAKTYKHTA